MNVDAERHRTRCDRGREHVAGSARVLADEDRASRPDQLRGRGAAEVIGQLGMQFHVRDAANAVGAKKSAHGDGAKLADGSGDGLGDGGGVTVTRTSVGSMPTRFSACGASKVSVIVCCPGVSDATLAVAKSCVASIDARVRVGPPRVTFTWSGATVYV